MDWVVTSIVVGLVVAILTVWYRSRNGFRNKVLRTFLAQVNLKADILARMDKQVPGNLRDLYKSFFTYFVKLQEGIAKLNTLLTGSPHEGQLLKALIPLAKSLNKSADALLNDIPGCPNAKDLAKPHKTSYTEPLSSASSVSSGFTRRTSKTTPILTPITEKLSNERTELVRGIVSRTPEAVIAERKGRKTDG
jgi:type II secretory pathway pseudopilin PulG